MLELSKQSRSSCSSSLASSKPSRHLNGKCTGDTETNVITQEQKHDHFANVDNHDGHTSRLFAQDITDRCPAQVKVKGYAQTAQTKNI